MKPTPAFKQFMEEHKSHHVGVKQIISADLPLNFDGRKEWPGCIHAVLDQGDCESCWSFAATESLSDRFCIQSNGKINVTLSPQNLLSCETENIFGCQMGSLPNWAWGYMEEYGVTTLGCTAYTSGYDGTVPDCAGSLCDDGANGTLYRALNYSHVGDFIEPSNHIQEIMKALMHGPVDATFNVYGDFDGYTGGVYQYEGGEYEGLHSVKVIGYGYEAGVPYWLVQNSWGPDWGWEHGYFKILRGADECSIESLMYTGFPNLMDV